MAKVNYKFRYFTFEPQSKIQENKSAISEHPNVNKSGHFVDIGEKMSTVLRISVIFSLFYFKPSK